MSEAKCLLGSNNNLSTPTGNTSTTSRFYYKNLQLDPEQAGCSSRQNNHEPSTTTRSGDDSTNNRTTDGQTMMHILKANIGTGVLAMPLAFRNVGIWLGLVLVPAIGVICIHCMNILIASHNRLCDRFNFESLDYDQVAALGLACGPRWARRFSKYAHLTVSIFLMFTQIGFCCVYTLFTVENLQVAMLNLFSLDYSTTTYLVAVFPVIGLTSCTSNLKHLARISTLANCLQLFGLALIFYDLLQFHTYSNEQSSSLASNGNNDIIVEQGISGNILSGLPLFFATAVYAFEGIGVVLPLIKEMQYPERISGLNGVLNTSMSQVALLYMAVGFFGYAKYGQTVAGSITLNLPESTLNELVRLAFALAIGLSYSLQFYVPWTIVWPIIDESLFYSYRPRQPRDKLDILQKLNKDNQWAITGEAIEEHQREQALRRQQHEKLLLQQSQLLQLEAGADQKQAPAGEQAADQVTSESGLSADEHESTASTLATSYTMSLYCAASQRTGASHKWASRQQQQQQQQQQYGTLGKLRNRLEDVIEVPAGEQAAHRNNDDDDDDDEDDDQPMPEVHWRPPPRSMRGKRKLVRYTVILLTVSFTFVAAALIPRLDLFISLIGALASSSLAIIFPALIQLCTFWNCDDEANDEEELGRAADAATLESERQRRRLHLDGPGSRRRRRERSARRTWTRRLAWSLFVAKNLLLVLFGLLGLVTGSYVSLAQLGVAW